MVKKTDYSFLIGISKSAKNSAYLLIPFFLALSVNIPLEYAWIVSPIVYLLKNYYEIKTGKKL